MTTITLLKALRDKLKIGNSRSIHLNALPASSASKLDLSDFNIVKPNFADDFIEVLTSRANFEFDIALKNSAKKEVQSKLFLLAKRLNTIILQNEDGFKEHGVKTFGFGYPILVKRHKKDPARIIKAPLFIWQLDIVMGATANSWKIIRNKSKNKNGNYVNEDIHTVGLNEVLLSFLYNDEQVVIPQTSDDLLDDFVLDRIEINSETNRFMALLSGTLNEQETYNLKTKVSGYIEHLPLKQDIDTSEFTEPYIMNAGVFGLYQSQKESIIKDVDKCIEKFNEFRFENLKVDYLHASPLSAVETDPSQQGILNSLGVESKQIIQGPPGTGKSQTLTALITNAIANDLKVLVVCEKKTALDVIRNNIYRENEKLGGLVAMVDDIIKDRDAIVSSVRDRISNIGHSAPPNEYQYKTIRSGLEKITADINEQHRLIDENLYEGKKWPDLVGTFLKKRKLAGHDVLNKYLDYKDFRFKKDQSELSSFTSMLRQAEILFHRINPHDNPFELLTDSLFLKSETPRGVLLDTTKKLEQYRTSLENILLSIEDEVAAYNEFLSRHFAAYYESIKNTVGSFLSYAEANEAIFGDAFVSNDSFVLLKIDLLSLLSKKHKQLKAHKKRLPELHAEIQASYDLYKYFNHAFAELEKNDSYSLLIENIRNLNQANENWYKYIHLHIAELVEDLSSESLHTSYSQQTIRIKGIEKELSSILNGMLADGILREQIVLSPALKGNIVSLKKQIAQIDAIIGTKEDFISYFEWRHFYISQHIHYKNTITKFVASKITEWVAHFESWYYYWLLDQNEHKLLPKNDEKHVEYAVLKPQLKAPQIRNTIWQWENHQHKAINATKAEKRNPVSLYNKRGSKGEKRNSLRKIIETDFNLFTSFFPVVMTNPSVCASILPLKEGLFDLVIFDEASQLRLEDTFTSLIRGKVKIVSGDSQQMPPSSYFTTADATIDIDSDDSLDDQDETDRARELEESKNLADSESLLDYAEKNNYKSSMLKVHYRSRHPDLIQFSNHAFYGNQLIPIPAQIDYLPIRYHEVNGVYHDQQNISEANRIVELLLHDIHPLENGIYPSVGVATLNLKQRNLISLELIKVVQTSENPAHVKKINDLIEAGLFVKNLENIQGDERDIIILSTTFGRREDGSFRQNFGPLLRGHGYKLLNVIITRAKLQLHVCTSIPHERIADYKEIIEQEGTKGKAAFYAFLAYARAISAGDKLSSAAILNHIWRHSANKDFTIGQDSLASESPFEEEVRYELGKRIGQDRIIPQYQAGSFRIDMIVKSLHPGQPSIAIECDGAKYHSSNEAYAWDAFRQKELERQGFIFHRIWSANWWTNSAKELNRLTEFISAKDRADQISAIQRSPSIS